MKPSCIWPVCIGWSCGFCVGVLFTALLCRRNERANSESTGRLKFCRAILVVLHLNVHPDGRWLLVSCAARNWVLGTALPVESVGSRQILHGERRAELVGGKRHPLEPTRLLRVIQRQGRSAMRWCGRRPTVRSQPREIEEKTTSHRRTADSAVDAEATRARSRSFVQARTCGGSAGNVQRGWYLPCRLCGGGETWPRSWHSWSQHSARDSSNAICRPASATRTWKLSWPCSGDRIHVSRDRKPPLRRVRKQRNLQERRTRSQQLSQPPTRHCGGPRGHGSFEFWCSWLCS